MKEVDTFDKVKTGLYIERMTDGDIYGRQSCILTGFARKRKCARGCHATLLPRSTIRRRAMHRAMMSSMLSAGVARVLSVGARLNFPVSHYSVEAILRQRVKGALNIELEKRLQSRDAWSELVRYQPSLRTSVDESQASAGHLRYETMELLKRHIAEVKAFEQVERAV